MKGDLGTMASAAETSPYAVCMVIALDYIDPSAGRCPWNIQLLALDIFLAAQAALHQNKSSSSTPGSAGPR